MITRMIAGMIRHLLALAVAVGCGVAGANAQEKIKIGYWTSGFSVGFGTVLEAGETRRLGPGLHIAYCPTGPARLRLQGEEHALRADGGLRIEGANGWPATCTAGVILMGSVTCVSR